MKAIIGLFIASMFGLELMSPFMVGYLNDKDSSRKKHASYSNGSNRKIKKSLKTIQFNNSPVDSKPNTKVCNIETIDFEQNEEINFSDSKSLVISENSSAFVH